MPLSIMDDVIEYICVYRTRSNIILWNVLIIGMQDFNDLIRSNS